MIDSRNCPPHDSLPHDLGAERAFLGALLLKPELLEDPACELPAADFYSETHQEIHRAARALHRDQMPIDVVTLGDRLAASSGRDPGKAALLGLDLLQATPHAAYGPHYARIVRELAARRRIIERAGELVRLARLTGTPLAEARPTFDELESAFLGETASETAHCVVSARKLSEVESRPVEWLWPERIPLGKLTLLAGDPGLGKSFLTIDLAARVSVGRPWHTATEGDNEKGTVLLFSAEDDPEDTIRPRLDEAGGDPERVRVAEGVAHRARRGERPRFFCLETDLPALEALLDEMPDCRLVVIDPISAYGNGKTDSHKNSDVRAVLAPLADLAARRKVAVVVVTHLNKSSGGKAVYRTTGSLAYVAAVRIAWLLVADREDPQRRLLVQVKNNLGQDPGGLAFRVEQGRLRWEPDILDVRADELLAAPARIKDEVLSPDALSFLKDWLASGPALAGEVAEAARAEGIGEGSLRLARQRIGATRREGFGRGSKIWWSLKGEE